MRGHGEAAFYGPKVDFQFKNLLGREETFSTIQLDFLSPNNFNLVFSNEQDEEEMPLIIHRAPLSSHERLISHLIEHFGGALPLWCAPVQVMIVPVAASFCDYANTVRQRLRAEMIRVELDDSSHSFSKKIKMAALRKIPVQLIVGATEMNEHKVTIRRHGISEQQTVPQEEAVQLLGKENLYKSLRVVVCFSQTTRERCALLFVSLAIRVAACELLTTIAWAACHSTVICLANDKKTTTLP